MIRLGLRQFRMQACVAVGLLAVAAILLSLTGPRLADIYDVSGRAQAACDPSRRCQVLLNISTFYQLLELIGTVLVAVPALVGAFWGAPLVAQELENGTHHLAWTQSVTRTRWLSVKLLLVGTASVAATGLLSLMVTWWSSPIDHENTNRFGAGLFGERNITPLGYAAFGFAAGVTAGVLIRRTLPAMAVTVGAFLGVRIGFTYLVRPYLLSPVHKSQPLDAVVHGFGSTNGAPASLFASTSDLPDAWIYSTRIVDGDGHALTSHMVGTMCPSLALPPSGPPVGADEGAAQLAPGGADALHNCVAKLSSTYHGLLTYQPANRYWTFQAYETGIYLAAALALTGLCIYWIRHRAA